MEEANFIMKNLRDEWPVLGQIHQSYLVKFQSCEHQNVKTGIEETEKMIEKLDQDEDQIIEKLKKKLLDRDELNSLLKTLRYREEDFERSIVWKRGELHPLQVARDKLCSVNKAYEVGTICSGGELNTLSLHHQMLHKTKSIAEEKKLLREIKVSQTGAVDPCLSMKKLNSRIMGLYSGMLWVRRSSAERKQLLGEIKELEVERDNMISTANLKGKAWDSLGSKEAILNKIKDISIDLDGTKEKHLSVKAEIRHVKKEMRAIDKCMIPLQKKLVAVYREKDVTYKHLLELRKQEDEGQNIRLN
eukprot:XP_010657116.2 PREDICTED: proton pump-interactor 1 [Vitis vinifera]